MRTSTWLPWILVFAVLACGNTASAQQQCAQVPAGLVAWWPGDGHTNDLSANNLHGAVVGDGVTYAQGKVGQAFRFDNQNGKVLVAHSPLLDPTQALTIEAWVQPWSPALENLGQVVDHAGAAGGGYALTMTPFFSETAYAGVHVSHGAGQTGHDALYSPAMPVNAWYHVVGAYDAAAQRYRLYVNGQDIYGPGRDLLSPDQINYFDPPANLSIGNALSMRGGIDRGFYGLVDEVRLYDRALTAEEVLAIYGAGEAGVCKTITIRIDIRPDDAANNFNCEAGTGVIAVAILSTRTSAGDALDFDATTVDALTVRFGTHGSEASETHNRGHLQDVDGDGDLDMMLHFRIDQTGLDCVSGTASLTGRTKANQSFAGSDAIHPAGAN